LADLRESARAAERGEWDPIDLARPYDFANFFDAAWLDDCVRSVPLGLDWFADVWRPNDCGNLLRDF
jgi:hypothetical protein